MTSITGRPSPRFEPGAFFGEPWPSGICDDGHQVATPVGEPCGFCETVIVDGDRGSFWNGGRLPVHRECSLRSVLGGIGHLEDHAYWCEQEGDPDGGRSRRDSSLAVWEWVRVNGFPA